MVKFTVRFTGLLAGDLGSNERVKAGGVTGVKEF